VKQENVVSSVFFVFGSLEFVKQENGF
jgi:hypothetical protein